ncbi:hypothetical protein [Actinacidiphila soli]|uniref:hypothetical protein n=1 Tax=Actinacidiphila soli TaxID=2487275 RepID=UPI0013E2E6EA|nr:hypothetical protein [Actinacidiphila soli]
MTLRGRAQLTCTATWHRSRWRWVASPDGSARAATAYERAKVASAALAEHVQLNTAGDRICVVGIADEFQHTKVRVRNQFLAEAREDFGGEPEPVLHAAVPLVSSDRGWAVRRHSQIR